MRLNEKTTYFTESSVYSYLEVPQWYCSGWENTPTKHLGEYPRVAGGIVRLPC